MVIRQRIKQGFINGRYSFEIEVDGENYFVGKDAAEALGKCKKCSPEPCQR
nr:MAG TPA: actin-like protein [Caudoviricetes sp.]